MTTTAEQPTGRRSRRTAPEAPVAHATARAIGAGLSLALLIAVVAVLAAGALVPRLAGATPYTVATGSMRPTMPPGSLVIVKPLAFDEIAVGDVVTYQLASGKPTVVTHRVVDTITVDGVRRLITQGDANGVRDADPVRSEQVRGTVWYTIPWLGWVNSWLHGDTRMWVIGAFAGLLFAYAAFLLLRRPTRPQPATERPPTPDTKEVL